MVTQNWSVTYDWILSGGHLSHSGIPDLAATVFASQWLTARDVPDTSNSDNFCNNGSFCLHDAVNDIGLSRPTPADLVVAISPDAHSWNAAADLHRHSRLGRIACGRITAPRVQPPHCSADALLLPLLINRADTQSILTPIVTSFQSEGCACLPVWYRPVDPWPATRGRRTPYSVTPDPARQKPA